jgi:hypothetical protein
MAVTNPRRHFHLHRVMSSMHFLQGYHLQGYHLQGYQRRRGFLNLRSHFQNCHCLLAWRS